VRERVGSRQVRKLVASLVGAVVLVLVLAQLLLPRLAAHRISARVGRYGSVQSVSVSAWPALALLWGHADSVQVKASTLSANPQQVAKLLHEAAGAASADISADSLTLGSLRLSDARLHKRGSALSATALASEAAVQAALPGGLGVQLLKSEQGQVQVRASGALFGVNASVDALALASEGRLVAHPLGFLIEGLQLTLFADRHVRVSGVGASIASEQPRSYRLTMTGLLD
jgi:hypothetical protein